MRGGCPHFETRYSLPPLPPTLSSAFVQDFYSLLHSLCILYLNQGEQKSKRVGKSVFVNFFVSFILAKEVVCGACFEPGNYVLAIHESPDLVIKKIASDQTFFKFDAVRATESFILFLFKIMTIHESLFFVAVGVEPIGMVGNCARTPTQPETFVCAIENLVFSNKKM